METKEDILWNVFVVLRQYSETDLLEQSPLKHYSRLQSDTGKLGMSYSKFKQKDLGKLGQLILKVKSHLIIII